MKKGFNDNLVTLMSQSKKYQNHRRKIQSIMNKEVNPLNFKRIQTLNTTQNFRLKAIAHTTKQKLSAIEKDNDLIFKKLLKVNNRKNSTFNNSMTERSFSHKSLNNFKKTLNSIQNQNNWLARKLISTKSSLSQQKLMPSYHRHLQVKQRLLKYEVDEDIGVIPKKIKSMQKLKFSNRLNLQKIDYGNSSKFSTHRSQRHISQNDEY